MSLGAERNSLQSPENSVRGIRCPPDHIVMSTDHITDHDLERYYLGMVTQEEELAPLEEHLLWCHSCVERVEETQEYVDLIRRAIIVGDFDLML
jgi:hypothetical protein